MVDRGRLCYTARSGRTVSHASPCSSEYRVMMSVLVGCVGEEGSYRKQDIHFKNFEEF